MKCRWVDVVAMPGSVYDRAVQMLKGDAEAGHIDIDD